MSGFTLQLNLIYDGSVAAAPAAFKTAITFAADFLESLILNPITVNIQVGYGEYDNGALPIGDNLSLGGALSGLSVGYSALKSALVASAATPADQIAIASLPNSDPTGGANFFVGDAEARALGLLPANSTMIDGAVGFNNTVSWNYSTDGQAVPGEIDFVGAAELELIHALGMQLGTPLMLFRYSAPGVRELIVNSDGETTPPAYFSIDGGNTNLGSYLVSSDSTLWNSAVAGSSIATNDTLAAPYFPGQEHTFSSTDALELDALGFNVSTSNGLTIAAATIQNDYLGITRTALPLDQATSVANTISAGLQTETEYVTGLLSQVATTTIPAVAVEASMYGAVGSSIEITKLATQFLPEQIAFAIQNGLNPQVVAAEAVGLALAFNNEANSTEFASNFGPSHTGTPNSISGDNAFAQLAAATIFGSASTLNPGKCS